MKSTLGDLAGSVAKNARLLPLRAARLGTAAWQAVVHGPAAPLPGETVHVDPRHIRGHVTPELRAHLLRRTGHPGGVVVGGDWDRTVARYEDFTEKVVYRSCHARWVEGRDWEDTPLVQVYLERLATGVPCRFPTVEHLRQRYAALDRIFAEATEQRRLSSRHEDLVRISVTRDHGLLWGPDGRHRVSIALIAGLTTIPARVGFIHPHALPYFQTLRVARPAPRLRLALPGARRGA